MSKLFDDAEKNTIKEASGASAQEQKLAKDYVGNSETRARIDAADRANHTSVGPKLRALFYGRTPDAAAVVTTTGPDEVTLAEALKKFPREHCRLLYARRENEQGELLTSLSPEDRAQARLAAQFFGIVAASSGEPTIRFAYETKRDRDAKRERLAKEAEAKPAPGLSSDGLPAGLSHDDKGNIVLTDAAAFDAWKQSQEASAQAKKTIAAALEQATA